jgi:hypothetical protein
MANPSKRGAPPQSSTERDRCCRVESKVANSRFTLRMTLRSPGLPCESLPGLAGSVTETGGLWRRYFWKRVDPLTRPPTMGSRSRRTRPAVDQPGRPSEYLAVTPRNIYPLRLRTCPPNPVRVARGVGRIGRSRCRRHRDCGHCSATPWEQALENLPGCDRAGRPGEGQQAARRGRDLLLADPLATLGGNIHYDYGDVA